MKGRTKNKIAIVGMACRFPDADNPQQLWENILAKRISFRKIPSVRLSESYFSDDLSDTDSTYSYKAAVLKNYSFPREKYKISRSVFDSTDLAHWLALDVASEAIEDSNFPAINEYKDVTGVFVGNTLTGEFSRANLLRLRWPYISKILIKELQDEGWELGKIEKFINETEAKFKSPFSPMTEDSLAGGLSNTIAGRICNYFDFNGGGYTVDGACSSSLLAVSNACNAISSGDLMIAITGGVDLSLDPFELVGFSRVGALAKNKMLVYDKNSAGFLPGEGCGFIVLMNYKEALKHKLNVLAVINGWGISSDGQGGLTRPTTHGQLLSFDRAYKKAGYGINDIGYIEGHGTGTKVGDETEIKTITDAINNAGETKEAIFLGSVKANIGHTKASAGIAGLMKAILCIKNQIIPPATGNENSHSLLKANNKLTLPSEGRLWPADKNLASSVSSMGFGGINTHVTLSSQAKSRKKIINRNDRLLLSSSQAAEIFLFSADTLENLTDRVKSVLRYSSLISFSELIDLSFALFKKTGAGRFRACVISDEPFDLTEKLKLLLEKIGNENSFSDFKNEIFFSSVEEKCRIGFLFPGQGTIGSLKSNFIESRFAGIRSDYFDSVKSGDITSAKEHQTAVVNYSITAIKLLNALDIKADVAVGHSLGELTSLYWSGVYSLDDLINIVRFRGELMTHCKGSMLSVSSDVETIKKLIAGKEISLACINTNSQLVLSGSDEAISSFQDELKQKKIPAAKLFVTGAFHSPMMKPVQEPFGNFIKNISFQQPKRKVISTVLGREIGPGNDIKKLLVDQFLSPVQFVDAINAADNKVDFWIEAGAGKTLSPMVSAFSSRPVASVDAGSNDITELLKIVSVCFCKNKNYLPDYLFRNRFYRDFDLDWKAEFISNPCENLILDNVPVIRKALVEAKEVISEKINSGNFLESFKNILSSHLELSSESLNSKSRMLDDLHLNSITVGQLLAQASRQFNISPPKTPAEYSNASIEEIAEYFQSAFTNNEKHIIKEPQELSGLKDWIREFTLEKNETPVVKREITENGISDWTEIISGGCGKDVAELVSLVKSLPGIGLVTALFTDDENEILEKLVSSVEVLKTKKGIVHFVIIQNRGVATGFSKSVFLENRNLKVTVITVNDTIDHTAIKNDIFFNKGFSEIIYEKGKRFIPELKLIERINPGSVSLINSGDVVLITGGGKGITSECAFELAKKTGCSLLIVGRSQRSNDEKLNENLKRFEAAGVKFLYEIADIEKPDQLKAAIVKAEKLFGKITSLIHGAGVNTPVSFTSLDIDKIKKTVSPKVTGLQNCLSLLQKENLKSVITFGSIIGSSGMHGNADYALANEWMRNIMEEFGNNVPGCKCLNLEWSVWSGAGMGEKLNVLEQLISHGISPISLDNGVQEFLKLVESDLPSSSLIVSGRFGKLPTLSLREKELPLLRFLEDVKVYYPGIELISDFILSGYNDLYLEDHQVEGTFVFPGVMGLEAMMQAASVLLNNAQRTIVIRNIEFLQPVLLQPGQKLYVRLLAVKNNHGEIEASLRCESSGFVVDHFIAKFSYSDAAPKTIHLNGKELPDATVINAKDVYDHLLFHTGRFRCLEEYKSVTPYSCIATASSGGLTSWFGNYFPAAILTGNPVLRDACLHAVQACVPEYTLLPVAIKEIKIFKKINEGKINIEAVELYRENDIFCYNIICRNESGEISEVLNEVKFSILKSTIQKKMTLPLAKLILQRKTDELSKSKIEIKFNSLTEREPVLKRSDGRPFLKSGEEISVSNHDNILMTVSGKTISGCDMETVNENNAEIWKAMLGVEKAALAEQLSAVLKENISLTSTRVWCAIECLKKSGFNLLSAVTINNKDDNGTVIFRCGDSKIISYCVFINEYNKETVFSILVNDEEKL